MNLLSVCWQFFTSVKLAITTLSILAVTSIIGTVIPQGEQLSFYAKKYGPKTAQFMYILDIHQMYYSWWFLSLLSLLCANLIVCSIDRFPGVWKIIHQDNLALPLSRLEKMGNTRSWSLSSTEGLPSLLETLGKTLPGKQTLRIGQELSLSFFQKGKWSRTGVYIVHLSILVIFAGAIYGQFAGFKGSVMLPEMKSTERIFAAKTSAPIDLGFTVRCNSFGIRYYENGMVREYSSSLTILENDREVLSTTIEVNNPLTYKGITFYQASYEPYRDFVLQLQKTGNNAEAFILPFQKQERWAAGALSFGVINAEALGQRVTRAKLWIKSDQGPAQTHWIDNGQSLQLQLPDGEYQATLKQMHATGLQVAKDPGVWLVYLGCSLMLIGLLMAFFMSHQRIWLVVHNQNGQPTLLLCGAAHKHKQDFARRFANYAAEIDKQLTS